MAAERMGLIFNAYTRLDFIWRPPNPLRKRLAPQATARQKAQDL